MSDSHYLNYLKEEMELFLAHSQHFKKGYAALCFRSLMFTDSTLSGKDYYKGMLKIFQPAQVKSNKSHK